VIKGIEDRIAEWTFLPLPNQEHLQVKTVLYCIGLKSVPAALVLFRPFLAHRSGLKRPSEHAERLTQVHQQHSTVNLPFLLPFFFFFWGQVLKYTRGQKYEPHVDYFHDPVNTQRGGHRDAPLCSCT